MADFPSGDGRDEGLLSSTEPVEIEHAPTPRALEESAFVLTAVGIPNRVESSEAGYGLYVPSSERERAPAEVSLYRRENIAWPRREKPPFILPVAIAPLVAFATLLVVLFLYQHVFYVGNLAGVAASTKDIFVKGEAWRSITALFLHGDEAHFAGNLLAGLGFAALLLSSMGGGLTWLGFLVSGAVGNALNAYAYRHEVHHSIGASTAVFGAVGVWVGFAVLERLLRLNATPLWRRLLVPLGAGLGYLGLWGSSLESDYMAHFWGFTVGVVYGAIVAGSGAPRKISALSQSALSLGVLTTVAVAWICALV